MIQLICFVINLKSENRNDAQGRMLLYLFFILLSGSSAVVVGCSALCWFSSFSGKLSVVVLMIKIF